MHPLSTVSLDGVAIEHEKVKGQWSVYRIFCVIRFLHRSFFSEAWISMLNTAVAAADAFQNSVKFDPWGAIGVEAGPVVADLKSCREKNLSHWKAVKDTRDRWFSAEAVALSAVGENAPRTTVCISDVVEVGDVQYVAEHEKFSLPCCSKSASSPGKGKERRAPVSPGVAKNNFLLQVHLLSVLHLNLLFRRVLRSRGQEEVVAIAVMPHFPRGI